MPKGHPSQRNKAFKGESKRRAKQRSEGKLKKKIKKQEIKQTKSKDAQQEIQIEKQAKNQEQKVKVVKAVNTKIIAMFPMNQQANIAALKFQLLQHLNVQSVGISSYCTQDCFLNVEANGKLIKQPLRFIFLDRNPEQILDACKVADIVCPVLSCRDCNTNTISLDPHSNANAFDEQGYKLLSNLRAQGLVQQVCYIQDLDEISQSKKSVVRKLFSRYFESEFPGSHIVDDCSTLMRSVVVLHEQPVEWRDIRGYMLPDDLAYVNGELSITGTWRGQNGLSADQLVHITGVDDFQIARIELLGMIEQVFETAQPESLDPICRDKKHDIGDCDDLLKDIAGMQLQEEEEQMIEQESDVSYEDLDKEFEEEAQKKREQFEIVHRDTEDLDYEDEVEYGVEVKLRERYDQYQGLKNIRTSEFDPLTFLPDEAEKIYNFRFLKKIKSDVLEEMKQSEQIKPGQRIKITLKNVPELIVQRLTQPNKIYIISGLLKHERKMTQMHVRFHRHQMHNCVLKSKHQVFAQIGFRRAHINPIYSRILNNCSKTKYVKEIKDDTFYLASFYFYNSFPQQPVIFWQNDFDFRGGEIMGVGDIQRCDTFQVILKRIVLTGYPVKINKRKAVIRMMFFNPDDIKFFKPIELSTKLGLRGNILEPLGTHGLMKCMFNNFVKPNDVVSLQLYKRVHPKFVNIQI
ncbi:unnamed protein product (macronuclear) [Paramecium tetraurelia]|uniref:Ribosome biogenesis protein BMS1/TSR1 C-terminal domain-containing protein n=1 Tax=Paramecium tetraurelia TaxID=5888 RepID=A0CBG3_PARTE|nr:uncharacterized protein GSPATT00036913001 [Paramecium tetraurelia]CAK68130.1 unnamed protein product [Paramecium tetraurelia]|eukprot:XP_001435527.1 hypothetical protein (macronuclear) [Paramecium tetraurelia strain d4-2]